VILLEGKAEVEGAGISPPDPEGSPVQAGPGKSIPACRSRVRGDISIALPEEELWETETGKKTASAAPRAGTPQKAGVGIDIGTTTVSAELIDLESGESLDILSELNDQRIFGADVMSRINAAKNGKTGELFSLINRQTERILKSFMEKWKLPGIARCAVSGNTTMLHLFCGADPSAMGEIPFTPVFLDERNFPGSELSLSPEKISLLPGISAFVGADIVSGLAFLDILDGEDNTLLVDIGTNGEMALFRRNPAGISPPNSKGRLYCCSTAAGPCFEGAEISCGIGAVPGAINKIMLKEGKPAFTTIGNVPPRGICGCGLIDALALMRESGAIDETGALAEQYASGFPLYGDITLAGRDVRQFQLAKSAILSGINILCKRGGIGTEDLSVVYIAGGFGFFIDKHNAVKASLLPESFPGKTAVCGNLSLKGAVQSLVEPAFLPRCGEIVSQSEVLELAADPDFMDEFTENMFF
jgi:uncharacterized 2Fe-2S/4Fe-4S cluster protein (DUF4445 family)